MVCQINEQKRRIDVLAKQRIPPSRRPWPKLMKNEKQLFPFQGSNLPYPVRPSKKTRYIQKAAHQSTITTNYSYRQSAFDRTYSHRFRQQSLLVYRHHTCKPPLSDWVAIVFHRSSNHRSPYTHYSPTVIEGIQTGK